MPSHVIKTHEDALTYIATKKLELYVQRGIAKQQKFKHREEMERILARKANLIAGLEMCLADPEYVFDAEKINRLAGL